MSKPVKSKLELEVKESQSMGDYYFLRGDEKGASLIYLAGGGSTPTTEIEKIRHLDLADMLELVRICNRYLGVVGGYKRAITGELPNN